MLFHFNPTWLPGGFIGVDVFLVISGYLITTILLDRKAEANYCLRNTLKYFWVSRIRRIMPAYFFMLVLVSLIGAVVFLPQDFAIYKNSLNQAVRFSSNNYFARFGDYFAPTSHEQPLLHLWSLAVEMQFYLLFPCFVLLLSRKSLKWLLAIMLVGLTIVAEYQLRLMNIHQSTYYSLYARLPEFFAGSLVASFAYLKENKLRSPWLGFFGFALVLIFSLVQPLIGPFPGMTALLPVAGAALILASPTQGFLGHLLRSKSMVWIGQLSYSLYLWHWPVLALLRYCTGRQILDSISSLLFWVITLLLAVLSYYLVESPLRAYQKTIKQTLTYGALIFITFASIFSLTTINERFTLSPLSTEYLQYSDSSTICHNQIVGNCLKGDQSSAKEVLVLGDSHGAMLNLFFDQIGKDYGFKARIITASSCIPIPDFDYQRLPEWAQKSCIKQINELSHYLHGAKVIIIAGMWSWHVPSKAFMTALDEFLDNQRPNAKVYLMSQIPLLNKNPMRSYRLEEIGILSKNDNYIDSSYKVANSIIQKKLEKYSAATYLSFDDLDVFDEAPTYNGKLIYFDESHLNEVGALIYAQEARKKISDIVMKANSH